jgi:hypothetical protein
VLDDVRPLRELAQSGAATLNSTVKLFSTPDAYLTTRQQPSGPRFEADAIFNGQNRPAGALISYAVNKPEEKKADTPVATTATKKGQKKSEPVVEAKKETTELKVKYDSVKLEIFNAGGTLINTIRQKAPEENGLYRMSWLLNEKADRNPSRERAREGQGRGGFGGFGGTSVLPGTYKLRLSFGNHKDSTSIVVKADPRMDVQQGVMEQRYAMLHDLQKLTATATTATDRLRESLEIVEDYEKKIKDAKRTDLKDASDKTKAMKDSVNALFDYILGKVDKRQGIVRSPDPTPVSYIQTARGYISRSMDPISDTDRRVYKNAEDKINDVVNRVNKFYSAAWPEYRTMMEKVNLSPFKDYEPIKN